MKLSVETLNDVVDVELEELPADMRARFHYISQLIEEFGLESTGAARQTRARIDLGNAHEGQRWNFPCSLRDSRWQTGRGGAGVHQEDTENAQPRNRSGVETGKGD